MLEPYSPVTYKHIMTHPGTKGYVVWLDERVLIEDQFKVTLYFLPLAHLVIRVYPTLKKGRCQVVLNEEQTDMFALRPSLDAAPWKILAAVWECECEMRMDCHGWGGGGGGGASEVQPKWWIESFKILSEQRLKCHNGYYHVINFHSLLNAPNTDALRMLAHILMWMGAACPYTHLHTQTVIKADIHSQRL